MLREISMSESMSDLSGARASLKHIIRQRMEHFHVQQKTSNLFINGFRINSAKIKHTKACIAPEWINFKTIRILL